jgi:hypothetical protein
MKKLVKSIIKGCYIINVVLANAYITSERIDSAVMELEVWKINHAGRPAGPARSGLFDRYRSRSEKNLTGYNYVYNREFFLDLSNKNYKHVISRYDDKSDCMARLCIQSS